MLRPRFVACLLFVLSACATIEVDRQFDLSSFESKVQRGATGKMVVTRVCGGGTEEILRARAEPR